ncbi:hypothetical protein BXZ70DRAFT_611993 [Cristinia sonorae]|uniref:Uncharacterized protein n=1 Tax=Cristinia sonorae TaxID=1940300 RepID=A0A8K0UVV0_9AGAR|nr:hypothetical protein BXZ70DRAFT_611993 [Cristinia sonorae]
MQHADCFYSFLDATLRQMQQLPYYRKIPLHRLQIFATDIALVSVGVRAGYLFDTFALSGQARKPSYILADTIRRLRQYDPAYKEVVILQDDIRDQFFFVNVPLFLKHCREGLSLEHVYQAQDNNHAPTFVLLDDEPRLLHTIPPDLHRIIQELSSTISSNTVSPYLKELLTIPEDSLQDIIPLAAAILEYPVGYVPLNPEQIIFLPWEVLDVYRCVLRVTDGQERMRELFTSRLGEAKVDGKIEVLHHQETHERVAL